MPFDGPLTLEGQESGQYKNHYRVNSWRFKVTFKWEGESVELGCDSVTGLSGGTNTVIEHRDGNEPDFMHKYLGHREFDNVSFSRPVSGGNEGKLLREWWGQTLDFETGRGQAHNGPPVTRNCLVEMLNAEGNTVFAWYVYNCKPLQYSTNDLDSTGDELLKETLECCVEGAKPVSLMQ